ncbi:hypothetical protein [Butyrivibrio sp. AC2005]|uniref:hypothetical protein n=1 Tax=Butyrivibrio sp. AC2005 TaxID=1280672 RepID=UPI0004262175|nr:hypothetical protein [Butyrivibrio sp. AC2005]
MKRKTKLIVATFAIALIGIIGAEVYVQTKRDIKPKKADISQAKSVEESAQEQEKNPEYAEMNAQDTDTAVEKSVHEGASKIPEEKISEKDQLLSYYEEFIVPNYGEIEDATMYAKYVYRQNLFGGGGDTWNYDIDKFEGQEGILGYTFADLDGDGDDNEFIVVIRKCDISTEKKGWEDAIWTVFFEAYKCKNNSIEQIGSDILDQINGEKLDCNYHSSSIESRVFIKHCPSGDELCTSAYYGSSMEADGWDVHFKSYIYNGNTMVDNAYYSFSGSDGFNEDDAASDQAAKADLETTATFWEDYNRSNGESSIFLVPWNEPNCVDLLYISTETDLNYEELWALYDGTASKTLDEYLMVLHVTNCMKGEALLIGQAPPSEKADNGNVLSGTSFTTVHGSKFYIPEGFVQIATNTGEYERNAAGGYTYSFSNKDLNMSIQVDEMVWFYLHGKDETKEEFIKTDYDYYLQYPHIDIGTSDNGFYLVREDGYGNYSYELELVNDSYCSNIFINYPMNSPSCEEIRDQFINSFKMNY